MGQIGSEDKSLSSKNGSENSSRPRSFSIATQLGVVSFFNDVASEVISRALPIQTEPNHEKHL